MEGVVAPARRRWLRGEGPLPVLLLTLAFAGLITPPLLDDSCTSDESVHLAAGYTYLALHDFRLMPEHPPLAKTLAALPLLFERPNLPSNPDVWRKPDLWAFGYQFLFQSGNDPDRLLRWGRVSTALWALLLILSVYAVARSLYGAAAGVLSLALAAFCTDFLAHGHLVTNDLCVATLFFLTLVAAIRWMQSLSLRWMIYLGILAGGAVATKPTAVILALVVPFLAILRVALPPGDLGRTRRAVAERALLMIGVAATAAMITLWGVYGFRYQASPDPTFAFPWASADQSPAAGLLGFARAHRLFPEAYLYGMEFQLLHNSGGHGAYALGMYAQRGWFWYFPFAFLVKVPVATIILMLWGTVLAASRAARRSVPEGTLLAGMAAYGVFSMSGSINIGIRHLLPIYPLLMVFAGALLQPLVNGTAGRRLKTGIALLAAGVVIEGAAAFPFFISHLNPASRILGEPYEVLSDSNVDWGQDLGRLKKYMDREGIARVKLAYFGAASPRRLGLQHEVLPGPNWYLQYLPHEPEWTSATGLQPGDVIAVSATIFSGALLENRDAYSRWVVGLDPVAVIGGSILVFRIPPSGGSVTFR